MLIRRRIQYDLFIVCVCGGEDGCEFMSAYPSIESLTGYAANKQTSELTAIAPQQKTWMDGTWKYKTYVSLKSINVFSISLCK